MFRMRLEASENRHEDLADSISQASKPILRQVKLFVEFLLFLAKLGTSVWDTHNSDLDIHCGNF